MGLAMLLQPRFARLPPATRAVSVSKSVTAMSQRFQSASALLLSEHGEPLEVLKLEQQELPQLGADDVKVKILASPINPSDVNVVQGKYPIKPKLPGVPGNEGVAQVVEAGSSVTGLKQGSLVVPLAAAMGFWRTAAVFPAADLYQVPDDMPVEAAATLCINPPSALRMLEEYVDLQQGDAVIQNGANSAVGQLVIQIAKSKGVHSINIVRGRPEAAMRAVEQHLQGLGADVVTTEEKLRESLDWPLQEHRAAVFMHGSQSTGSLAGVRASVAGQAGLPAPKLGLNCVGGSASAAVAKMLAAGGTMVTYGGMSMQPVTIPTGLQIFKGIKAMGFWLSGGSAEQPEAKRQVLDKLVPLVQSGAIKTRTQDVPLSAWREAFEQQARGTQGAVKTLLKPQE